MKTNPIQNGNEFRADLLKGPTKSSNYFKLYKVQPHYAESAYRKLR